MRIRYFTDTETAYIEFREATVVETQDLGEDAVLSHHAPVDEAQARGGVAHQHGREVHVRRRRDARDAAAQVELDHGHLEIGLVRRVDEVGAPRVGAWCLPDASDDVDKAEDSVDETEEFMKRMERLSKRSKDDDDKKGKK